MNLNLIPRIEIRGKPKDELNPMVNKALSEFWANSQSHNRTHFTLGSAKPRWEYLRDCLIYLDASSLRLPSIAEMVNYLLQFAGKVPDYSS